MTQSIHPSTRLTLDLLAQRSGRAERPEALVRAHRELRDWLQGKAEPKPPSVSCGNRIIVENESVHECSLDNFPLMTSIPGGTFKMGEGLRVCETEVQPFAMGVYAVTFEEYDRFCEATGRKKPNDQGWGRGNRPVINVSWNDAQAYCAWLTEQSGRAYRLPNEAEWEYACRAGTTTPFYFGEHITTDQANFDGSGTYNGLSSGGYRGKTVPVGSFPPNAFGLFDMHGNVWEWCRYIWRAYGQNTPVLRGGSWDGSQWDARSAVRSWNGPVDFSNFIGFRIARPISPARGL